MIVVAEEETKIGFFFCGLTRNKERKGGKSIGWLLRSSMHVGTWAVVDGVELGEWSGK